MHCPVHGIQHVDSDGPVSCPACLVQTGQVNLNCENHGLQVVKPGNSCGFCVSENVTDTALYRLPGRENEPMISYFKPTVSKRRVKK